MTLKQKSRGGERKRREEKDDGRKGAGGKQL